ncbi:MAG: GNAT family N-acetyltransferase [Ignavibacteriaceae bacterium]|nr:GNAT family N-acetyltransferase [Ignavibacteriaceae bacterium]
MIPEIKTKRLILNAFNLSDAGTVTKLLKNKKIYENTINIPFPYKKKDAQKWISEHPSLFLNSKAVTFAIRFKDILIGAIDIRLEMNHLRGEIGYWIGFKYWNKGYCSEAAAAVIKYAFEELKLNKIHAQHMAHNVASGFVMQKCGMEYEGYLKQHYVKQGKFIDSVMYGITKESYKKLNT